VGETTRRLQQSFARSQGSESKSGPLETRELQIRISCGGKTAERVLEEVRAGMVEALAQGRDPLVVLEDLGLLEDSITTLIKGLSRVLVGYPRTVTFWESSGFTEAFMSVLEAAQPPPPRPPQGPGNPA